MAKVKKKSSVRSEAEKLFELWQFQTEARWKNTEAILAEQDADTQDAIEAISNSILQRANGTIRIRVEGSSEYRTFQADLDALQKNAIYQAVEILKDLALLDIKVANFDMPKNLCAGCGKNLKTKKKGRK